MLWSVCVYGLKYILNIHTNNSLRVQNAMRTVEVMFWFNRIATIESAVRPGSLSRWMDDAGWSLREAKIRLLKTNDDQTLLLFGSRTAIAFAVETRFPHYLYPLLFKKSSKCLFAFNVLFGWRRLIWWVILYSISHHHLEQQQFTHRFLVNHLQIQNSISLSSL